MEDDYRRVDVMAATTKHCIEILLEDHAAVEAALGRAVRRALLEHKRAGNPICAWRDGKVVWIPPEEIEIPEEPESGDSCA